MDQSNRNLFLAEGCFGLRQQLRPWPRRQPCCQRQIFALSKVIKPLRPNQLLRRPERRKRRRRRRRRPRQRRSYDRSSEQSTDTTKTAVVLGRRIEKPRPQGTGAKELWRCVRPGKVLAGLVPESLKDFAKRSPTEIVRADDTATLMAERRRRPRLTEN